MNKSITLERTWQLVQFEPLRVSDTISEIPEFVLSNPDAMKLLRYLQLIDIESVYVNYANLRSKLPKLNSLDAIIEAQEYLEEERRITFEQLLKTLSPNKPGMEEKKPE